MKVGLVVPQFGINTTKENLINFVQIAEKEDLNYFGYMIELKFYSKNVYPKMVSNYLSCGSENFQTIFLSLFVYLIFVILLMYYIPLVIFTDH